MPQVAVRHAELLLKDVMPNTIDKNFSGVFHAPVMPSFLTCVKPSDSELRQEPWRTKITTMELKEKPFGDIAARLRWHREIVGLDQAEYASRAGLKRSQLSNWESGNTRLSIDGALALRQTYELSLDFMYEGIADALPMTLRSAWIDRPRVIASR